VSTPTPLLDLFKRGEATRDVRLQLARAELAPRAHEQAEILMMLVEDPDPEIGAAADATLRRIPDATLRAFLARSDVSAPLREFFAQRGVQPAATPAADASEPLIDLEPAAEESGAAAGDGSGRESVTQQITKMNFSQRLKAAVKGSREMRAILIRDPNKMIAASVLSSPKLSEPEVESFARMANVSDEVLRIIGSNRTWLKNYGIVVGLTKNPKTPLAMSLNLMSRLNDRDLAMLSVDRNVPEPLRVAARKKIVAGASHR
jgi:hypothetical protein